MSTALLPTQVVGNILLPMSDELAEVVRTVLQDLPCSERQLALDAGLAPSTLSRIRSGERSASLETVKRLADALYHWAQRSTDAEMVLRQAIADEEAI